MKISIEEIDETERYRDVPLEQFLEQVQDFHDRVVLYIPNLCGGETRITIYKTTSPLGNLENIKQIRKIKRRNKKNGI